MPLPAFLGPPYAGCQPFPAPSAHGHCANVEGLVSGENISHVSEGEDA